MYHTCCYLFCYLTGNAASFAGSAIALQGLLSRAHIHNPSWEDEGKELDLICLELVFMTLFVMSFLFKQ